MSEYPGIPRSIATVWFKIGQGILIFSTLFGLTSLPFLGLTWLFLPNLTGYGILAVATTIFVGSTTAINPSEEDEEYVERLSESINGKNLPTIMAIYATILMGSMGAFVSLSVLIGAIATELSVTSIGFLLALLVPEIDDLLARSIPWASPSVLFRVAIVLTVSPLLGVDIERSASELVHGFGRGGSIP